MPTPVSEAALVLCHTSKLNQLATSHMHLSVKLMSWGVFSLFFVKFLIITSNVGKNIRKLVKDRLIMRRQVTMHSRSRAKAYAE